MIVFFSSEALKEVLNVISRDKTPLMDMPLDPPLIMHPESQKEFTNFSLLTHGFGVPGHAASWSTALKLIDTLNRVSMNPKAFCSQIQRPEFHWMEQKPFLPMQPPTNNFNF
uniref:Transcription factor AP-2 C-terminal domain-containing protein n=1 Tax=Panagrolaimus sp. JU765 TaxID=591449 RepID=A0AC34QDZ6_9BILA